MISPLTSEFSPAELSDAPTEIIERILDFLHDDRAALLSASLVCHKWVHTPRYHLFKQTVITEIIARGRLIKENARSFLALTVSKDCTILPVVRHVILVLTSPQLIDDVVQALSHSPALSRIVYIHRPRSDSISWNGAAFSSVREFAFDFPWSTFDDNAWRLVTSFFNLETLSIYTTSNTTIAMPSATSISPFRNLRTLRLRIHSSEELFDWILLENISGLHSSLEVLDLRILRSFHAGWGSVKALNLFLKANSETLVRLSVGIDYYPDLDDKSTIAETETKIDLNPLVNLRHLFLRTHDINSVCDTLASLNSSELVDITLHTLHWRYDQYIRIKECDCIQSRLFEQLSGVMKEKVLYDTTQINLHIPKEFESDGQLALQLTEWERTGKMRMSIVDDDDVQQDSLDSIRPLLWPRSPRATKV